MAPFTRPSMVVFHQKRHSALRCVLEVPSPIVPPKVTDPARPSTISSGWSVDWLRSSSVGVDPGKRCKVHSLDRIACYGAIDLMVQFLVI
jgi:hypothetical protein